jgi:adenylate cyclase
MPQEGFKRKLTAIFSADVVGYSRLMGEDEDTTVQTLTTYRDVISALIKDHHGRVVDSPGDNILAEFVSVVNSLRCAWDVQQEIKSRNIELPENRRMNFRIGINLGDVIEEEDRIYGDGVNIAARLESLAEEGGICISGPAYDQVKNKLPFGYEDQGEQVVKNISEPIRVYKVLIEKNVDGLIFDKKVELPDKPSIAVMPFVNMGGDPEQEHFSDGLTEDLITDLSKFSGMFVISRNSVFIYKGQAIKSEQVKNELGVHYMMEGSVRKAGNRVPITAQLIDTTTGGHLWAERYDRELKDIFTLQDEITQQIVSALDVKFFQIEQERALRKETANLNAFDCCLRGMWYFHRFTREDNEQARLMFKKAIELAPKFADAYAGLGFTYYEQWARLWSQEPQTLERAFELAKKAISLNDSSSTAYTLLSRVYLWKKQHAQAIAEQERAIALNPNSADGYADLAETLVWARKPEEALGFIEKAMRLNPHYPARYLSTLGFAYSALQRREDAMATLKRALTRSPDHYGIHITLAVYYTELGQEKEARWHVSEALRVNPELSIDDLRQRLPFILSEGDIDVMRRAGLPE